MRRPPPLSSPAGTLLLLVGPLMLLGCGGGGTDTPADRTSRLPLLPAGTHLGVIYTDEGGDATPLLEAAFGRCLEAGLDTYELSVPWDLLEPTPGAIDVTPLEHWLDVLQGAKLIPYVVLPTIDTNTLRLPTDFVDPLDPRALAGGRAFDDVEILERFSRLLDAVVPLIVDRGGFYLSVGNEVDIYLGEYGGGVAYARFAEAARRHVRELEPELAVGVTLTWGGFEKRRALCEMLLESCDTLTLTHYPFDEGMQVRAPSLIARDLDAMVEAAGEKALLLQEIGYPAGDEPPAASDLGSSAELQHQFVAAFFEALASRPKIRFASYFALSDFPASRVDWLLEYYGIDVEPFREFLATLGLHRADGTPRPAFEAFLEGVRTHGTR